ncbi:MAG: rhodanese-like domain-containing protein [Acidimicrobiia bacterium]
MSVPEITVDELATRLAAPGAALFDVRQPDEYRAGHVPSAVLVPLNELADRVAEFPTDGDVLVICRSGARSSMACEFLAQHGRNALNVAGGMLAWVESGRDVSSGDSPS